MTARPPISDAALRDRLDSILHSRNPADVNRLIHGFDLTDKQLFAVNDWSLEHVEIRVGRESKRVTEALARVDELRVAGKTLKAALIHASKEFGYSEDGESLRKARTRRRAARLRT